MFFGLGEIKPSHMCRGRPIADAARGAPHILSDPVRQIVTRILVPMSSDAGASPRRAAGCRQSEDLGAAESHA